MQALAKKEGEGQGRSKLAQAHKSTPNYHMSQMLQLRKPHYLFNLYVSISTSVSSLIGPRTLDYNAPCN